MPRQSLPSSTNVHGNLPEFDDEITPYSQLHVFHDVNIDFESIMSMLTWSDADIDDIIMSMWGDDLIISELKDQYCPVPGPATRPVPCGFPGCNRRFQRNFSMHKHRQAVHYDDLPIECITCKKRFLFSNELSRHISHARAHPRPRHGQRPAQRANKPLRQRRTAGRR